MSAHTIQYNDNRDVPELLCLACIEAASQKKGEEELVPAYALKKYSFAQLAAHLESDVHNQWELVAVTLRCCLFYCRLSYKQFIICQLFLQLRLVLQQGNISYCKYCGSTDITDTQITREYSKTKGFQSQGKIGPSIASVGGSLSAGNKEGSAFSYKAKYCNKCYNKDLTTVLEPYGPIMINCLSSQIPVIIPYTLSIQLKTQQYSREEILKLISYLEEKFDWIYKKWSKDGTNPCKRGRLGYKTRIFLRHNIEIVCWTIIDGLDYEIVYRLIYGGGKVHCP